MRYEGSNSRSHTPRGTNFRPPSIFALSDIEGSESRVLPHLISRGAMCLVDRAYMEWHPWSVGIKKEFLAALKACESKALHRDFSRMTNDDETYATDGKPWPSTRLCD